MAVPAYLVDTNILLRMARRDDPDHSLVDAALARLAEAGVRLYYTHQNVAEYWNVCTRPVDRNGFGLSIADTDRQVRAIEKGMRLLPDSEAVYNEWRRLVVSHSILGVKVHDARLVAAMHAHAISCLLTFNPSDFARYSGITVLHPRDVL